MQLKSGVKPLFAMRVLKKRLILASGQREHILREGRILMETHCPFIVRCGPFTVMQKGLFGSFQDSKNKSNRFALYIFIGHRLYKTFKYAECLYILTEACLGGNLSSLLNDKYVLAENKNVRHIFSLFIVPLLCS